VRLRALDLLGVPVCVFRARFAAFGGRYMNSRDHADTADWVRIFALLVRSLLGLVSLNDHQLTRFLLLWGAV
jgi:hypothetical protein